MPGSVVVPVAPGWRRVVAVTRVIAGPVACLVMTAVPLPAQQPDDAARLAVVRERYAVIQAARMDSTALDVMYPGGSGVVTVFRSGTEVRKLVVTFDGDGASGLREFFFWNDSLQFAYRRWTRYPEEGPSAVGEDRLYFASGRLIRWLRTEEDRTRRVIAAGDRRFVAEGPALIESAACWRRYHAEGQVAERVC